MRRNQDEETAFGILKEVFAAYGLNQGLDLARLRLHWKTYLGPDLDRATKNLSLKNGVLYATMDGSVPRAEVFNRRSALCAYLNEHLTDLKISTIRLV